MMVPNEGGDGCRLRDLSRRRYQSPSNAEVVGHEEAVFGLEVVVGPLDDDPPQFAERVLELDLKVVAVRGRVLSSTKGDDERPIRVMTGRSRNVSGKSEAAKGVGSKAVAAVGWSIESASLVRWQDSLTSNSPRSRLVLQASSSISNGTKAPCRQKTTRFPPKSLAWARLHPFWRQCYVTSPAGSWSSGTAVPCTRGSQFALEAQFADRLSLERLPPFAPTLNPVEALWSWLKYSRLNNFAPRDPAELDGRVVAELSAVRTDQAFLRSLFRASELPIRV